MTISRAEVITSFERRRRWPQDDRWRNELCKHGEASIAPFVPVEMGPSVPPREVAEAPLTTTAARRLKSLGIIELHLGSGLRIRVDGDVDGDALRRVLDALVRG
jgi:transposase